MMALLDEVIVVEGISTMEGIIAGNGKAEFETHARHSLGLFESCRQTIRSLTLGERTAAVEIEFDGVFKDGGSLLLRGVTVFAFSDGKISRVSTYS